MKKVLGARLRQLRGTLSQSEFARKIGVKQTSYSGWESELKVPAATVIAQIATTIGVSADWILGVTDDRDAPIGGAVEAERVSVLRENNENLRCEIERLRGENAGLRYAIESIGKGAVTASARRTAQAFGA